MINYHTTSVIHLSLEKFYNAGLTEEKAREIITSMGDPCSCLNLRCHRSGLNGNWNVETSATNPEIIEDIVGVIHMKILYHLEDMNPNPPTQKLVSLY